MLESGSSSDCSVLDSELVLIANDKFKHRLRVQEKKKIEMLIPQKQLVKWF